MRSVWTTTHPDTGAQGQLTTGTSPRFYAMATAGMRPQATEANAQIRVRTPGTLSNLAVRVTAHTGSAASVRSRVNGANGNQLCLFAGAAVGYVEDTTNTDAVVDDDLVNYQGVIIVGGSTVTWTVMQICFTPTSTTDTVVRYAAVGWRNKYGTTDYAALSQDAALSAQTTEAWRQCRIPTPQNFDSLQMHVSVNSTGTVTARFRKNAADGNQVISIGGASVGFFEDTSNTDAVAQGDLVNFTCTGSAGGGTNTITVDVVSVEGHDANRRFLLILASQADSFNPGTDPAYYTVGGGGGVQGRSTETHAQLEINCGAVVASRLWVFDPVGGAGGYLTLRKNAADSVLRVGPLDAGGEVAYQDLVNSVALASDTDDVCFQITGQAPFSVLVMMIEEDLTQTVQILGGEVLSAQAIG